VVTVQYFTVFACAGAPRANTKSVAKNVITDSAFLIKLS